MHHFVFGSCDFFCLIVSCVSAVKFMSALTMCDCVNVCVCVCVCVCVRACVRRRTLWMSRQRLPLRRNRPGRFIINSNFIPESGSTFYMTGLPCWPFWTGKRQKTCLQTFDYYHYQSPGSDYKLQNLTCSCLHAETRRFWRI